jgi:16S rRNA (cytosine967-C5)-methyltransferase
VRKPHAGADRRPPAGTLATPAGAVPPWLLRLGCEALAEILSFAAPADALLRRFFREHPKLGRRDRGFIAEAVFCVLRRLRWFTELAGARDPRRLFLLGAAETMAPDASTLHAAIRPEDSSWLEAAAARDVASAPLGVRAELPDWVIGLLRERCSEDDVLALGHGMQAAAPLDLRVNSMSASRDAVLAQLRDEDIGCAPTPYSPLGIRLTAKPALEQHPLYLSGAVEVQDEGSQLLGFLLAPRRREMVVDFCAGAGGKTLLLGALMRSEGRLYAFDIAPPRIQRLRRRVARAGLSNVQAEVVTSERDARFKRLAGKIDRVLVDAPCTGFGTLRRNPDLKWRQTPADLATLRDKQARILESAVRLLKPGGRLVYATCSILPQENDAIVDAFLRQHPDMAELDCEQLLLRHDIRIDCGARLRLLPHRHGTDGFFAAAFEKCQAPDATVVQVR